MVEEIKKEEKINSCYFSFDKNTNIFSIEINNSIYLSTSKDFNTIVYNLFMFYNDIINKKVADTLNSFVQDDNTAIDTIIQHNKDIVKADDAGEAVKFLENLLQDKKNKKPEV